MATTVHFLLGYQFMYWEVNQSQDAGSTLGQNEVYAGRWSGAKYDAFSES